MSYGKITVGAGTSERRDIEITDFIQVSLKDNRLISVSQLEDGSIVAPVENPPSSGRSPQSNIWLSKESFVGLLAVAGMYFEVKGDNLFEMMSDVVRGDEVHFSYSDNLNPEMFKTNQ